MNNKLPKRYAKTMTKADKSYAVFKRTNDAKAKTKAKKNYHLADAYMAQLQNPAPNVRKTYIKDSFNFSKETTYGVNKPKTSIRKRNSTHNY